MTCTRFPPSSLYQNSVSRRSIGSGKRTRRDRERPGRFINGCIVFACFTFQLEHPHVSPRWHGLYFTCLFRLQLITYRVASHPRTHVHTSPGLSLRIGSTTVPVDLHNTWLFIDSRTRAAASLSLSCKSCTKDTLNGLRNY